MSFDNHARYPNAKDQRKQYRGAKSFDRTCRNHGSCSYCYYNRTHRRLVEERRAQEEMRDFLMYEDD